jgi:tetratricopeptide (TPR) repeat protein
MRCNPRPAGANNFHRMPPATALNFIISGCGPGGVRRASCHPGRGGRKPALRMPLAILCLGLLAALRSPAAASLAPPPARELQPARQWVQWGDWNRARNWLRVQIQQHPADPQLLAYYAHVLNAFGRHGQAIRAARHGLKLDPRCGECHLYLAEALGARIQKMGHLRALWNLPRLRRQLRQALEYAPTQPDAYWGYINFYMQAPRAVGGSLKKADSYARRLGHYDPVDGLLAQAQIAKARGLTPLALQDYRQAIVTHAADPRGYFHLGRTLFALGHYRQAASPLARAHQLAPHNRIYAAWYAAELVHLQRMHIAWKLLRRQTAGNRLGDFLVAQALKTTGQNFDWARRLLARYLASPLEPDAPSYHQAQLLLASLG